MGTRREVTVRRWESPVGRLVLGSFDHRLCLCDWDYESRRIRVDKRIKQALKAEFCEGNSAVIDNTIICLEEYFAGALSEFDVSMLLVGTEFQKRVWAELMKVPYGTTSTYAEIASRVGNPKGVRAVANSIGANPISIIVPCHRIVGSDGRLTGYAGGLNAKESLLRLEDVIN